MANRLSSNPWVLDTAAIGVILFSNPVKVRHFEFSGYAAATDKVVLKDNLLREIWRGTGAADLQEVRSSDIGWVNGIVYDSGPVGPAGGVVNLYIA